MIRVIIVEDDPSWLNAVMLFLSMEPDIEIVGTAGNYDDAVHTSISTDADVILMDINLTANKLDGIYATAEILARKEARIIILTGLKDDNIIHSAFSAGAINYIMKNEYIRLPEIIRQTYERKSVYEVLARDYVRLRVNEILAPLTEKEHEILMLLTARKTKREIADELFISELTLKNHISKILKKLHARSISEVKYKLDRKGFVRN